MRFPFPARSAIIVLAGLVLTACAEQPAGSAFSNGYLAPEPSASGVIALPNGSLTDSLAAVRKKLAAAGLSIRSVDSTTGVIQVASNDAWLVDCGMFFQTVDGVRREIPANSAKAILFSKTLPGGIVLRKVAIKTKAVIKVVVGTSNVASIAVEHKITVDQFEVSKGRKIWSETANVTGSGSTALGDGTRCTSSGTLGELIK